MNPVVNPVVTELYFIGQGGPQAISGVTHTQIIIEGGGNIVHGDSITHILTNLTQVSLESDYFPFNPEQVKTLMVTSLVESLLTSNGNKISASILGARRSNMLVRPELTTLRHTVWPPDLNSGLRRTHTRT